MVAFVQFKNTKREKHPWWSFKFSKVAAESKFLTQIDFCFLEIQLPEKIGLLSEARARAKGYEFKNDPTVDSLFDYSPLQGKLQLALAIDTSQLERTFQDR